jgi:hypothetical protein
MEFAKTLRERALLNEPSHSLRSPNGDIYLQYKYAKRFLAAQWINSERQAGGVVSQTLTPSVLLVSQMNLSPSEPYNSIEPTFCDI